GHRALPTREDRGLLAARMWRISPTATGRHRRVVGCWCRLQHPPFHYLICSSYRNSCRSAAITESWTSTGRSAESNTVRSTRTTRVAALVRRLPRVLASGLSGHRWIARSAAESALRDPRSVRRHHRGSALVARSASRLPTPPGSSCHIARRAGLPGETRAAAL